MRPYLDIDVFDDKMRDEYDSDQGREAKKAIDAGFIVHFSNSQVDKLLLDIDSKDIFDQLPERLKCLNKLFKIKNAIYKPSKSGNFHVIVHMEAGFSKQELFLLEVCLGSDWKRGLYNIKNLKAKEIAGMLFTVKGTDWTELKF